MEMDDGGTPGYDGEGGGDGDGVWDAEGMPMLSAMGMVGMDMEMYSYELFPPQDMPPLSAAPYPTSSTSDHPPPRSKRRRRDPSPSPSSSSSPTPSPELAPSPPASSSASSSTSAPASSPPAAADPTLLAPHIRTLTTTHGCIRNNLRTARQLREYWLPTLPPALRSCSIDLDEVMQECVRLGKRSYVGVERKHADEKWSTWCMERWRDAGSGGGGGGGDGKTGEGRKGGEKAEKGEKPPPPPMKQPGKIYLVAADSPNFNQTGYRILGIVGVTVE